MSDRERRRIHDELTRVFGEDTAELLMARLPEHDWTDVVRQRDMDMLRAELHADMAELRVELMDAMRELTRRVDRLETKIDKLDARIDGLEARIDGVEARIAGLRPRMLLTQFAGSLATVAAVLAGIRFMG